MHPDAAFRMTKDAARTAEAMLDAIAGFELIPTAWRGTAKRNQNRPAAVRARTAGRLGDHPLAAWMHVS